MSRSPFAKKEDIEKVEAQKKAVLDARKLYIEDLKWVLSTAQGRRFLWKLLAGTNILSDCFDQSGSITNFNLGKKNVGLRLLEAIEDADQEAYFVMRRENKGDSKNVGT